MIPFIISLLNAAFTLYFVRKYALRDDKQKSLIAELTTKLVSLKEDNERLDQKNFEFSEIICGLDENVKVNLKMPETIDFIYKIVGPQALLSKLPTKEWLTQFLTQYTWIVSISIHNQYADSLAALLNEQKRVKFKHQINITDVKALAYFSKFYIAIDSNAQGKIKESGYKQNISVTSIDTELELPKVIEFLYEYYKVK